MLAQQGHRLGGLVGGVTLVEIGEDLGVERLETPRSRRGIHPFASFAGERVQRVGELLVVLGDHPGAAAVGAVEPCSSVVKPRETQPGQYASFIRSPRP